MAELGIPGVSVGHWTDRERGTGCTIVLVPQGAIASIDVRGGGPGTRESDLLSPLSTVSQIHAVCLCGGSARGLGAAEGVSRFLEEQGRGYETPYGLVPLVPAAVLYDLALGDATARPGPEEGYAAAAAAEEEFDEGTVGAGTGATVGKALLTEGWMKGGLGAATLGLPGGATLAALTVVNAFGDVLDEGGGILAGARRGDRFLDSCRYLLQVEGHPHFNRMMEHTTLSVVVTDGLFSKVQCALIARMAHDGLARSISPVHTPVDGDVVFVLSTGRQRSNVFQAGIGAAEVVAASVRRAVRVAGSLGRAPALADMPGLASA